MQDYPIYQLDFEKSEGGMFHHIHAPKGCALFLPETLVEEIQQDNILNLNPEELAAQIKAYKKIEESKIAEDGKVSTDVLKGLQWRDTVHPYSTKSYISQKLNLILICTMK